jgi:hypothetical protein
MASVWGGDRVAVRIGPGGTWNHMSDSNSEALFDYLAGQLNRFGLAYPRVARRLVSRPSPGVRVVELVGAQSHAASQTCRINVNFDKGRSYPT